MGIITVSGPPGSGTSTACTLLEEKTGFLYIYAGNIFREMAKERGMDLLQFGKLCETDSSVDRELDTRMMEIAKSGDNLILEGRMTGALCKKEDISSFKIYIDADPRTRALRIMERDGGNIEEVIKQMKLREDSEIKRYEE
jgi:predicted cytidylate kinase